MYYSNNDETLMNYKLIFSLHFFSTSCESAYSKLNQLKSKNYLFALLALWDDCVSSLSHSVVERAVFINYSVSCSFACRLETLAGLFGLLMKE